MHVDRLSWCLSRLYQGPTEPSPPLSFIHLPPSCSHLLYHVHSFCEASLSFAFSFFLSHNHLFLIFQPKSLRVSTPLSFSSMWTPTITHPFVVFERSSEAHGLNELCESPDFFLGVLGRLLHVAELRDEKQKNSEGRTENGVKEKGRQKERKMRDKDRRVRWKVFRRTRVKEKEKSKKDEGEWKQPRQRWQFKMKLLLKQA